jgi:hypothetical protein
MQGMSALRVPIYWLLSFIAGGLVAALARFHGYSGGYDGFVQTFWLYALPIPMSFGLIHIPTMIVGSFICSAFTTSKGRLLTYLCGGAFFIALLVHLALRMFTGDGHWYLFAFVTVDLALLAAIGVVVAE